MSLETAARLQDLDLMARQISTQISAAGRPVGLPSLSVARSRLRERGLPRAEETILALQRRLDEVKDLARCPARLPTPSQPSARPGDGGRPEREKNTIPLKRGIEETDGLLGPQELHGEGLRSQGDEQRAQTLLLRTRTLLKETRDQLAATQKRAEEAEGYLSALHQLIRINLDFGRASEAALTRR